MDKKTSKHDFDESVGFSKKGLQSAVGAAAVGAVMWGVLITGVAVSCSESKAAEKITSPTIKSLPTLSK